MASAKAKHGWKGRSGAAYGKPEEIVPKEFIRIQPLPYEDSLKAEVVARTSTILMDQRPTRDDFSRSNQARRKQQMDKQGLKSAPTAPYGELGSVEMDTKALIARTLGQLHNLDKESSSECSDEEDNLSGYSSSSSVGLKVPAEASDMVRLKLDRQLKSAQRRLDDVSLGRCLFTLVRRDEQDRLRQGQEAALEESKRLRDSWHPGRDAANTNAPGSMLRVGSTSAGVGLRSVSAVSRGHTTRGGADGTDLSATSVEACRSDAPRARGSGRRFKKKLEKINIDGGTSVPRLSQSGSRQTLDDQSDSSSDGSWSGSEGEGRRRDSGTSGPPGSATVVDGNGSSSSVRLGAFSRGTVDDGMGSDEDDDADLKSLYKYLSAMRWILDGMLADNPATLPPVMESWLPGTHQNSLRAHQERFQKRKITDEKWEEVIHRPVTKKPPRTAGLKVPRRPRIGGADAGRVSSPQQSQVGPGPPELALRGDVHSLTLADCDVRAQTRPSSTAPLLRVKSGSRAHQKLGKEDMEWFLDHISQHGQRQRKAQARSMGASLDAKPSGADADASSVSYKATPVDYDPQRVKKRFNNSRARRDLIVQTQLMAMEKERYKTCQQKFEALLKLGPNGRIWDDLRHMRAGVQTESAEMARRKLMMNYQWYDDLILSIPAEALSDRLCSRVLARLKKLFPIFVDMGPDRLDKKKLFGVLCQLEVWERELPEVEDAINFVRNHVIFIPDREFGAWRARGLQEHNRQQAAARKKGASNPALDDLIKKKMRAATEIMTAARMI